MAATPYAPLKHSIVIIGACLELFRLSTQRKLTPRPTHMDLESAKKGSSRQPV
jgi:hypothetical protein